MKSIIASIMRYVSGSKDLENLPYRIGFTDFKGRGLYAVSDIPAGTKVIRAPLIHFDAKDTKKVSETILEHYIYCGFDDEETSWIPLGHALLINHSTEPNLDWFKVESDKNVVDYIALKDIKSGEEFLVDYGYEPSHFRKSPIAKTF